MTEDIKHAEEFLRIYRIIKDDETFSDFILKPYIESSKAVEDMYARQLQNFHHVNKLLLIPSLITFSSALFDIEELTELYQLKINAKRLKEHTDKLIIRELSPIIIKFFKWDLDRRVWKHQDDEYKISYLQKITAELDNELQGKSQLVKKYIQLLIEFGTSKFQELIANVNPDEIQNRETFDAIRQIEEIGKTDKLNEIIDEDTENSFSKIYAPAAQLYRDGLLIMPKKYDFLLYSFIEAQNDYKKLVNKMLVPTIASDLGKIRHALSVVDIDTVISILRSIYATIPHELYGKQNESLYHISFHVILKLIGCKIVSEFSTSDGRIDAVIEFDDLIYIVEIKLTNAGAALKQIKEKEYDTGFLHKNKSLYLLGLAFDTTTRNINEVYAIEKVK